MQLVGSWTLARSSGSAAIAIEAMRTAGVPIAELRGMPRDELRDFVTDFVAGVVAPFSAEGVDMGATVSGQRIQPPKR